MMGPKTNGGTLTVANTGSIIGNLLLVLGFAMVAGGIRNGKQIFNKTNASRNAILLVLAVIALVIPSVFSVSMGVAAPQTVSSEQSEAHAGPTPRCARPRMP